MKEVGPALKCRFGETESVWPESETGAKVEDGFLRNLRDTVQNLSEIAIGSMAEQNLVS